MSKLLYKSPFGEDELYGEWDEHDVGLYWVVREAGSTVEDDVHIRIPHGAHAALLDFILEGPPGPCTCPKTLEDGLHEPACPRFRRPH